MMKYKQWIVSVISTDYDLLEERRQVIQMLQEVGFRVSAFELPDFPTEPHKHSHDVCLAAIERADIVVLIINRRYGGLYVNDQKVSITEKELKKALGQQKLLITCVDQRAWDEKETYNRALKDYIEKSVKGKNRKILDSKAEATFAPSYRCSYVEKVQTLQLINRIRKLHTDNYICMYSDSTQLGKFVNGKLAGFSRYICEMLVKKQCEKVKSSSGGIHIEFGIDELLKNKQYYVDPPYATLSGSIRNDEDICKPLRKAIYSNQRTLIIGRAGSGKSVLVSKMFLQSAQAFLTGKNNIYVIPFFISLRNRGGEYHFDMRSYLEECMNEYLGKEMFPLFDLEDIHIRFFVDGFDELCETLSEDQMAHISTSDIMRYSCLISSRLSFAHKYLLNEQADICFQNVVRLLPWDRSIAKKYIVKFCRKNGLSIAVITDYVIKQNEYIAIYSTPLLLAILLWLIRESEIEPPYEVYDQALLLKKSLEFLISRELRKGTYPGLDKYTVLREWAYVAWKIYSERSTQSTITLDRIYEEAVEDRFYLLDNRELFRPELVFEINSITHIIKGSYHEQFLEYLTSFAIVEGCLGNHYPYPAFLWYMLRPEINAMIGMEFNSRTAKERESIYEKLWDQYLDGLTGYEMKDALKQIQSIYQVTKLKAKNSDKYLQIALRCEKSMVVKPSLMFNAVKNGCLDIEEQFLEELNEYDELAQNNRGFHLAYYGDRSYTEMPYMDDDISYKWTNTYNALLRHFERKEDHYYYIRRIDLHMIQEFMSVRGGVGPVTVDGLRKIKLQLNKQGKDANFDLKVKIAFNSVVEQYGRMSGINCDELVFLL